MIGDGASRTLRGCPHGPQSCVAGGRGLSVSVRGRQCKDVPVGENGFLAAWATRNKDNTDML